MQSFTAPMLSRNPVLHYVFARMELAEERGLGLKSMQRRAQEAGLPLPTYTWEAPYLVLTLYRTPASAVRVLPAEVRAALNADEQAAWEYVASQGTVTTADLIDALGFDKRKTQRILGKLVEVNLAQRIGRGPATRYEVAVSRD